jgi:ribosomal protein L37E
VPVASPTSDTRWRCRQCGNLTRFDVVRSTRSQEFWHVDLSGEVTVEERHAVSDTVEHVVCRWCGQTDSVDLEPRPGATGG